MKTTHPACGVEGRLTITRSFGFSASHELRKLPPTHKCSRNHGHNYTVTASALVHDDAPGDVTPLGGYLDTTFDHRLLNDQVDFHPTSELLALHLANWFRDTIESRSSVTLLALVISETATTSARYDGDTNEITISKKFVTSHSNVTLVLGADQLDEFGFITDFGDLAPFAKHVRMPTTDADLRIGGSASIDHLASWFIANVEPEIHGHLVSMGVESGNASGLWQRGGVQ